MQDISGNDRYVMLILGLPSKLSLKVCNKFIIPIFLNKEAIAFVYNDKSFFYIM